MYIVRISVYARINPTNNFPYKIYVQIRVYVHIHAIYDQYTYKINHNIRTIYMHIYQ